MLNTPSALSSPTSPHTQPSDRTITRRPADYSPGICDDNFVQSLSSVFKEKVYTMRVEKLQDYAKHLLEEETNHVAQLELIDTLQRLGVGYLFNTEIKSTLSDIKSRSDDSTNIGVEDLHPLSLKFRLMRQHGYMVPHDIFNKFRDDKGNFKECLSNDIKEILSLFEASHLGLVGENILDQARTFTVSHLKEYVKEKQEGEFERQVEHALELPLHWRVPTLEARWFIDVYQKEKGMNPSLLELAKLNFNISQFTYQTELKATSRWWKDLGMARKLNFSRDRLGECFMWAIATMELPQYGCSRELLTRVGQFITTIDDVYDVYGTLDELELFTDAVERWDVNVVEQLPDYMKLCFLALLNITNQIGYEILKEKGCNGLPYLKGSWAHLCNLYLVKAKWYHIGYTPSSIEEYLSITCYTISATLLLLHTYVLIPPIISKEILDSFQSCSPNLVRWSGMVLRFCDDLATSKWAHLCNLYLVEAKWYHTGYTSSSLEEYLSIACDSVSVPHIFLHIYVLISPIISKEILDSFQSCSPNQAQWSAMVSRFCDDLATSKAELERGDIPKSIQCYMYEARVSEEEAREHIQGLAYEAWKHMNKDVVLGSPFSKSFIDCALGFIRMTHSFYHHGDAFGAKRGLALDYFKSFVVEPIPLEK